MNSLGFCTFKFEANNRLRFNSISMDIDANAEECKFE